MKVRVARLPAVIFVALSSLALLGQRDVSMAEAQASFARSEPPAGATLPSAPFVLSVWFSEELVSRSTIRVADALGAQVDLGDGRVDLDDVDRKRMLVSLPALPNGVYTVSWSTISSEDGDTQTGAFTFGVGVEPASPWRILGRWQGSELKLSPWLTVHGPWRIRWHLDQGTEMAAIMIEEEGNPLPELILGKMGVTDGVIDRERGGTYRIMFHNYIPYDVTVEDFVGARP
jgi:methionine-rich copper-binding protein CopC